MELDKLHGLHSPSWWAIDGLDVLCLLQRQKKDGGPHVRSLPAVVRTYRQNGCLTKKVRKKVKQNKLFQNHHKKQKNNGNYQKTVHKTTKISYGTYNLVVNSLTNLQVTCYKLLITPFQLTYVSQLSYNQRGAPCIWANDTKSLTRNKAIIYYIYMYVYICVSGGQNMTKLPCYLQWTWPKWVVPYWL